ncbi:carboxy terminal-processing peptidase [Halomonas denitrificans]|uniref:carboxy terminal-processing peptidase n=1 Tax=Halomonas TaxID=2745 RepID=UPI001A8F7A05|nr:MULTISPECIES: carboxy terminal-processing peptidase [Halomonas]MED5295643.1 carboxy terminal-processing peptidase [Pseudomonadota bacterium]MBN8413590.1 carboxy terminal-processing peptidase [Halomonas litopenaei]MBY5931220.1 carboxy terminal-processing peptidase [Halomonas sp. DP8Y7-3]MBY5984748.1 carboxy terminal-processing peptidase [Halomonas sp. DP5Y7-2]MBY6030959.1 carboxy terminal-processing peptidase [Halomonas sp. DP8Y7-1]
MSLIESAGRALALSLLIAAPTALATPTPGDDQRQAAMEVAESLRYGHYADVKLDDQWSNRAFQRYLDVLDGQRAYFLQDDVDDFGDLRTGMDEALLDGSLARAYDLYQRYHERAEARLDWMLDEIDDLDMSFDGQGRLELDREDASWAASQESLDELWRKRLANAALTLSISGQDDDKVIDTLRERYETQKHRLEQTNSEDVFGLIMAAATGTVDPHTEYLSPRQGESFDIQMRLSLEGIGALLQADGEYVKVASLVPGGPAEKDGALKPADRIIGVGQEGEDIVNVVGMRLDDVVELIRGPKGSEVRLEVVPGEAVDMTRSTVVDITRDTVKLEDQAASSEVIEVQREDGVHKVGVIEVPAFYVDFDAWQAGEENYRSTTRDVAAEVEKLKAEGVEGIVLDLRNNGGGALQEANSMIGLFIDRGPTVQVRDARGRISLYGDTDSGTLYDGPLVVLVNRLSASASEIFAGAIQDYGRGLIVGSNTFGKGTVQTLNDLSYGQIKLTRAKFYRISGESTQNRGVKPDIMYPSLLDPEIIGESALDNALPWDTVRDVQYRSYGTPRQYLKELRTRHQQRADDHPNFHYLEQRAELASRLREQHTSVSLNREQRQREADAQDAEMLSLENERREALGLDILEEWGDARESGDDADLAAEEDAEEEQPVDRAEVEESAEILLDFAELGPSWQYAVKG